VGLQKEHQRDKGSGGYPLATALAAVYFPPVWPFLQRDPFPPFQRNTAQALALRNEGIVWP